VKRFVTSMMGRKQAAIKGGKRKREEKEPTLPKPKVGRVDWLVFPAVGGAWKPSKCTEKRFTSLHFRGIAPIQGYMVEWHPASSNAFPFENTNESDFFCGLLFFYGIQLIHLNPNSII
jgi:hypothetical protein